MSGPLECCLKMLCGGRVSRGLVRKEVQRDFICCFDSSFPLPGLQRL